MNELLDQPFDDRRFDELIAASGAANWRYELLAGALLSKSSLAPVQRGADAHRDRWPVEPTCVVQSEQADIRSPAAPDCPQKSRESSPRARRDTLVTEEIMRIHADEHMRVYGIRKIHAQLNREGIRVARCTVERL